MTTNQVKLAIVTKRQEAIERLVNGKHENLSECTNLQGYIQGLNAVLQIIAELEKGERIEDDA